MQNQDVRRKNPRNSAQSGNALWFILVAIALLAALTLTLTRNSGKMATNLDQEEARIVAQQMIRQMTTMAQTVNRLVTVNKCSINEISFDNTVHVGTYTNAGAPVDERCHVFRTAGGGLTYERMPTGSIIPGNAWAERGWGYISGDSVNGVGPESVTQTICAADCGDLIMFQQVINQTVCLEFNKLLNVAGGTIPTETDTIATGSYYTGSFGAANTAGTRISTGAGDSTTSLYGVQTACVLASANNWLAYTVLIPR